MLPMVDAWGRQGHKATAAVKHSAQEARKPSLDVQTRCVHLSRLQHVEGSHAADTGCVLHNPWLSGV